MFVDIFLFSLRQTFPLEAIEYIEKIFRTPEESFIKAALVRVSIFKIVDLEPVLLVYCIPFKGKISNKQTGKFLGKLCIIKKL
jgi:hypothetical protein